jgi:outer membrane protein assembly factor BamB/serine/threonine protein kinase
MEPLRASDPRQIGEFRLHARLGAGGMGQVFLGYSPAGRAVAVKVCHPDLAADPAFVLRFAREVDTAGAVNGLYTAQVVAAGPRDDPPWLATTYVPGPSLQQTIRGYGPLPEAAVWRLAAGLAEALRAIHARGIVHRDLKPTNVLLAADGPRVIDFGIARALDGAVLTTTGYALGSPSYMSPEQVAGQPASPASDVFALGSVICFAACAVVPFGEGDAPSVLFKIMYEEPVLDAMPSAALRELAAACLVKDPRNRATLAGVLGACQPYVHGGAATSFWPGPVAELIDRFAAAPTPPPEPTPPPTVASAPPPTPTPVPPPTPVPAPTEAEGGRISRRSLIAGVAGVAAVGLLAGGWALTRKPSSANAAQNRLLWAYQTGGPVTSGAAIDGGLVYIGGQDGHIYALHAADGRLARSIPTAGSVLGAVTASDGLVIAGSTGHRVHAIATVDGKTGWTYDTGGPVRGQATVADGVVYIGCDDRYFLALDAGDGRRIWRTLTGGPIRSTPLAKGLPLELDYVYTGSEDGLLYAFDTQSGKVRWHFRADGAMAGGALLNDGSLYTGSAGGSLYEVTSDGSEIWSFPADGAITGTPVSAGGSVYTGSADASVYAVDMGTGIKIWSYLTGAPVRSGLAIDGSVLYAGSDDGYLSAIDIGSGGLLWRYRTGGAIRSQILAAGDAVYFGSLDHHVYAVATS